MRRQRVAAARNSQFGHVTTSFMVVPSHFTPVTGVDWAESGLISGTKLRKVVSMTLKTCSDPKSELDVLKATVLKIFKIMFIFF